MDRKSPFYKRYMPFAARHPKARPGEGKLWIHTNGKDDRPQLRELVTEDGTAIDYSGGKITLPSGKTNSGDVLYVSVDGDNDTATRGEFHKPWRTPWDAAASSQFQTGDTIVVLPGTYTASSDAGDNADFTGSPNLAKEEVYYYMYPGVILDADGAANPFFRGRTVGTAQKCYVYGHAQFITRGSVRFVDARDEVNEFHIECHSIECANDVSGSAWGNSEQVGYFYLKAQEFTKTGTFDGWWESPEEDNAFFYVEIADVDYGARINVTSYFNDGTVATNVTRIEKYGRFKVDMQTNYFYDLRSCTYTDSYFEFSVENMEVTSTAGNYDEFFRGSGGTSVFNNTQMHMNIQNGRFSSAFWRDLGPSINIDNAQSGLWFTGKYYFTDFTNATNVDAGFEFEDANMGVTMDCEVSVIGAEAIRTEANLDVLNISGKYHRREDAAVFNFNAATTVPVLQNCFVSNTGAAAPIAGVAAVTLNTAGLYQSNAAQDIDITYNKYTEPS